MSEQEDLNRKIEEILTRLNEGKTLTDEQKNLLKAQQAAAQAQAQAAQAQQAAAQAQEHEVQQEEKTEQDKKKRDDKENKKERNTPWHQQEVSFPGAGYVSDRLKGVSKHAGNHGAKYALLLAFLIHFLDMESGGEYTRNGQLGPTWAVIYLVFALIIAPLLLAEGGILAAFTRKDRNHKVPVVFTYVGLSVAAWLMPIILSYIPQSITQAQLGGMAVFNFFILISPIWAMYIMFTQYEGDGFVSAIRNVWLWIWIFLLITVLLGTVSNMNNPAGLQGSYNINPTETVKEVWYIATTGISDAVKRIVGIGPSIGMFVQRNLNDSLGNYYQGQVDPYSSRDLGVRIVRLRPNSNVFYEGNNVVVWADLQGESFRDSVIAMTMRCYAKDTKGEVYEGTVQAAGGRIPNEVLFTFYQPTTAQCTVKDLQPGNYDIHFAGTFNFETWAYVPYYFAPLELVQDIYANNNNPAREAGITEFPTAIYNSGPVRLGLSSQQAQPIPLDNQRPRILPVFGASLQNDWYNGEITSVRNITLLVPEPFKLINCDRTDINGQFPVPQARIDPETGYRAYTFDRINNPTVLYESVTCFLALDGASLEAEQATANQFLQNYDLVLKTFGAQTNYLYTISEQTRIRVLAHGARI